MDARAAVKILKKLSIFELAGTEGCLCMGCKIQGISIDVSCRKSSAGQLPYDSEYYGTVLRVHSNDLYAECSDLQLVADEVASHIKNDTGGKIVIRFCDFEYDHKVLCTWCNKPRQDAYSYYCDQHKLEFSKMTEHINDLWQPIETAPKDGTVVDLWVVEKYVLQKSLEKGERVADAKWGAGWKYMYSSDNTFDGWATFENIYTNAVERSLGGGERYATHWMPIIPPLEL